MIRSPKHWSIRGKAHLHRHDDHFLALILTIAAFALFEYFTFRQHLVERLETLGQVIGGNSTAAIAFNRPDDATATLATLSAETNLRAACIYNGQGEILARYSGPGTDGIAYPPHPGSAGYTLSRDSMAMFLPVKLDGNVVGTVYLRSDLGELYDRL